VLPGVLSLIAPVLAIIALLVWAGRLMLKAETADDVAEKLDARDDSEKVLTPSYGFQVAQPDDDLTSDKFVGEALREEFGGNPPDDKV
jgi:hypothetical protein